MAVSARVAVAGCTNTGMTPKMRTTSISALATLTKPAPKRQEKESSGVCEKEPGSGIRWVAYFANGKKKREKVGSKSDAIAH